VLGKDHAILDRIQEMRKEMEVNMDMEKGWCPPRKKPLSRVMATCAICTRETERFMKGKGLSAGVYICEDCIREELKYEEVEP